jgi:iron complex transport system permease protein
MAGMIGWVGPHSRILHGACRADNKILVPASALVGAIYLVVVMMYRAAVNVEVTIGITTSLIGYLFLRPIEKSRRGGVDGNLCSDWKTYRSGTEKIRFSGL